MIINTCFNTTDPNVGLELNAERVTLKCYMADTGLLFSHAFSDQELTEDGVYKAILFDKIGLNEGMFLENIVAQMLKRNGHKLFFYSRSDRENAQNRMEIDFLIRKNQRGIRSMFHWISLKRNFPGKLARDILYIRRI